MRPGHAIYGYISAAKGAPRAKLDVQPALSWKATILAISEVPAGARVGYGAIHTAERDMRIAILAAGYADGMVLLVRIEDGAEILAKRPGEASITALAWSGDGALLAFGTESGEAGIVNLA